MTFHYRIFVSLGRLTSATSATSEGAQGIFSKITFLKLVHSKETDEACLGVLVKIFTKSVHRGGVNMVASQVGSDSHYLVVLRLILTSSMNVCIWYAVRNRNYSISPKLNWFQNIIIYRLRAIISRGLYIFYPTFHCSLYCGAVNFTNNLCTKKENSNIFWA